MDSALNHHTDHLKINSGQWLHYLTHLSKKLKAMVIEWEIMCGSS